MIAVERNSANELFTAAVQAVIESGQPTSPRGELTHEVLGAHLRLLNPRNRFVSVHPARILNPAFAVAEALWIISGSDASWIFDYNRELRKYADHGRLRGAYGPRIRAWRGEQDQLEAVRSLLLTEPDSRQAVIQIFDPEIDRRGHKDVPCTLSYRFFVRSGRLHMHTSMRSQDAWLGLPYDIFNATIIQELMAGWLNVELGYYEHHVDSLHVYKEHIDVATSLPVKPPESKQMSPLRVSWDDLSESCSRVLSGHSIQDPAWQELSDVLSSYRSWRGGDRSQARAMNLAGGSGILRDALDQWYERLEPSRGQRASHEEAL